LRRRGTTLIEVLISIVVTALVAASVGSLLSMLGGALREQDQLASQMVRTAGGHARLSDHILRARAILACSATEFAVWVPCEDFILSNQFREAYDEINTCEIRWYSWVPNQKRLIMSRTANHQDMSVREHSVNWSALRSSLESGNQLETVTVFDGLDSVVIHAHHFNACSTRRISLDLVFDAAHGGQTLRVSEAVPFLQKHKDCP